MKAPQKTPAGTFAYLAWAALLNLPFLVCHPDWPIVEPPLVRSLAVGLLLILVPGLPWVGVMIGRGWLDRLNLLYAVIISPAILLAVLLGVRLSGWPLHPGGVFNAVWIISNVGIGLNFAVGGPPGWGIKLGGRSVRLGVPLFLAAYLLFFYSAIRVVPPMEDQDLDSMACGYGLLTRFEPLMVGDRDVVYQFSHPPLAFWYTAGSFLYFDRLDYLKPYDEASQRARSARRGKDFEWFGGTVGGLTKGTVDDHRVVGLEGADYLITPALNDGSRRIPVWLLENAVVAQHYERDPQKVPARAPHVFLAALTVALLGCWVARMSGGWPLAVLVAIAYATSPEIFVRSGYGGHFASSNFIVLLALMTLDRCATGGGRGWWLGCFLLGGWMALSDHKLVLLPAAVVVWELLESVSSRTARSVAGALLHPLAIGFVAGMALFWAWALAIDPRDFVQDHLRTHLVDRLTHHNPLGYTGYPGVAGLWEEFWWHTGYLLLPLGLITLGLAACRGRIGGLGGSGVSPGPEGDITVRLWLIWTVLNAVAFSLIDWRQTKHLMPLMLTLHAAPARWAGSQRLRRALVALVLAAVTVWNLFQIYALDQDFSSFKISVIW